MCYMPSQQTQYAQTVDSVSLLILTECMHCCTAITVHGIIGLVKQHRRSEFTARPCTSTIMRKVRAQGEHLVVREVRIGVSLLFSWPSPDVALLPAVMTKLLITCWRNKPATTDESISLGTKATPLVKNTLLVATRSGTCTYNQTWHVVKPDYRLPTQITGQNLSERHAVKLHPYQLL